MKLELKSRFGVDCPLNATEQATDMHEVMLLRNDAKPIDMLAYGAYCADNCVLVSRDVNERGEDPKVRGFLVKTMQARGLDPLGWFEQLPLKGKVMPKIDL